MTVGDRARRSEFSDHLAEMRYRWKPILAAIVATALIVGLWRAAAPSTYVSTASLRLTLVPQLADDGTTTQFQAAALAELATTPAVLADAVERAGSTLDLDDATDRVSVDLRDTPGFLEVSASASSAEEARDLADAVAAALVDLVDTDPALEDLATLSVSTPAELPAGPSSPRPVAEALLASLIVGLLVAEGLLAWRKLRGRLSPVAPASEIERLLGVPTLHLDAAGPASSEAGAALPFVVQHLGDLPILTVVQRGHRADARAAALIGRIASGIHRRVLMVDADLGRPVLHETVGTALSPGLSEVLTGEAPLGRVLQRAADGGRAAVVSAGAARPDGITGRRRLVETDHLVRSAEADRVILSTTQNSAYDDALTAVHIFGDAVVLAVDATVTSQQLRRMAREVRDAQGNLAAVVLLGDADTSADPVDGRLVAS